MSFKVFNFHDYITNGLERMGYVSATPIQQQAIQPLFDGRNLLGLAQTGTVTTAAFALPILENLSSAGDGDTKALIISPTRKRAQQTYACTEEFFHHLNIRCSVVYGGVSREAQIRELRKGADSVVACPRRASRSGEAYTFATTDDRKMIKSPERTLNGGLVYRDSPGMGMMADTVIDSESTVKKKMVATVRKNHRKARGKRSSQRNRAVSFDFGI